MASTLTPNMGLIVPGVGTEPGPTWGVDLNSSLGILDQHNHSSGQGVQITPDGINISKDLPMNSNNLVSTKTVRFTAQVASLPGSTPNLGCVYIAGNELYYNDESGNVVAITNNGSVNAGSGSITGLPSGTASATYSSGSGTFVWQSATSTPANMDFGSGIFRNISSGSKGVTLSPPSSLPADYNLFLPAIPGSTLAMTLDTSGNMGTTTFDSLTTTVTATGSNNVADKASRSVGATTATSGGIAISSLATFGYAGSAYVDVTNLTVTITTNGRPVYLTLAGDVGTDSGAAIQLSAFASSNTVSGTIAFLIGSTIINSQNVVLRANVGSFINLAPSSFNYLDTSVNGSAGTYTYKVQLKTGGTSDDVTFGSVRLMAWEIGR